MKNQSEHTHLDWEQISRYISGEMNVEEQRDFEGFIENNQPYADAIQATKSDLSAADHYHKIEKQFDADSAWDKLQIRIIQEKPKESIKLKSNRWSLLKIAAVMLAIVALSISGYLAYQNVLNGNKTIVASIHDIGKKVHLNDGSIIILNAGATVKYPTSFSQNSRKVVLIGEAYFSITKNKSKPFVIHTPNAEVKVLGTTFNVNASLAKTEVLVETGMVQLSGLEQLNDKVILAKGDMATFGKDGILKHKTIDVNHLSWKTRKMVFDAVPLTKVVHIIEKTYGVKIQLPQNLSDSLLFTATFEYEPIDLLLESIGKSFNLTYEKSGASIQFKAP